MTPLARRVMMKVRQKEHGSYERWFEAIVAATLDEIGANPSDYEKSDDQIVALLEKPKGKART